MLFASSGVAAKTDTIVTSSGEILQRLQDPNVAFQTDGVTTTVYSLDTGNVVPQGLASDGSGHGFSPNAVVWIVFAFMVGVPLLTLGIRGWRFTVGAAVGLAVALSSWTVFVNALDDIGTSDTVLTSVVLVLFVLGFFLGILELSQTVGILILSVLGGLALGIRIILLRDGLLLPDPSLFFVNWLLIALCGLSCGILVVWKRRIGVLIGCTSTGSFLCGLGLDLVVNQQSGMSRGLRYLMDRNRYHVVDNVFSGYSPPASTVVILVFSIVVIPAFAFAQHKLFKRPFLGIITQCDLESLHTPDELPPREEPSSPSSCASSPMPVTPTSKRASGSVCSRDEKKDLE